MSSVQDWLWAAGLVLAALLAAKLAVSRLFRVYKWFFFFLCFQITRSLVLLPFPPNRRTYALVFLITEPILWLLYILVVLELYSLALRNHPGIASLSRWTLSAALVVSVVISAVTLRVDLSRPSGRYRLLVYYSVMERGLTFSLVLFLLLITVFLVWYPVSIRRNVVVHASVYSVYFLSMTMALLIRNVAGYQETTRAISAVLLLVDLVCFSLWIAVLNRRGEERLLVVRRRWRHEDEERLVKQLDALNDMLLRHPRE
jgi:hypothetical protein